MGDATYGALRKPQMLELLRETTEQCDLSYRPLRVALSEGGQMTVESGLSHTDVPT